jgi:hypothetical protein
LTFSTARTARSRAEGGRPEPEDDDPDRDRASVETGRGFLVGGFENSDIGIRVS